MMRAFAFLFSIALCGPITAPLRAAEPAAGGGSSAPVPPPSSAPQRSAADLQKLVAPVALYPDPLVAFVLPASAYPVEIVLAARFVANSNNIARIDSQTWDKNVKAVAKFPTVIKKMSDDLAWTKDLGQAFIAQEKGVMDAIQSLRTKAKAAGTLTTTFTQNVIETNAVVERTYDDQVVYVTNTVIEIQPANYQTIYVPTYDPIVIYNPPVYVNPLEPLITIGAAVAIGAIIANNCDWHYGGIYVGGGGFVMWGGGGHPPYYPPPPGYRPPAYQPPPGYRPPPPGTRPPGYPPPGDRPGARPRPTPTATPASPYSPAVAAKPATSQRWQPDQARLSNPGSAGAASRAARGWAPTASAQPGSPFNAASRPPTGTRAPAPRPSVTPVPRRAPAPPAQTYRSGGNSAFSGVNSGANTRRYSNRGAVSRGAASRGAARGRGR